jgi:DnaJ-domain-containing protein 1
MRKIHLLYVTLVIVFFLILVVSLLELPPAFLFLIFLLFYLYFIIGMGSGYFKEQPFGYAFWVNPILQLSIILIKLDGVEKISETKRIIKYLNDGFDPVTVKYKLRYYKKQLKIEQNLHEICARIRETKSTKDKVRVLQHLIRLALSDRLLSDQELEFLEKVTKRIGIHQRTLKAILRLHIYVTEEDIRNQKLNKSYVNSSSQKAFSILGLELNATKEEVKEAYRSLVMIYHPDKLNKSERNKEQAKTKFQAITDAYQFLKTELN